MSRRRPFLGSLLSLWAFLVGFLASLAWFIWTETQQTNSTCGRGTDYVQSAAITFAAIIALTVARRRPRRGDIVSPLLGEVLATVAWTALGLAVAIYFAGVTGCSA
ncbi:MAG TPA: hypothetical protein VG405_02755 [Solirubrobacteraceae bacterium]|jgi:hypothetical protein|nr:hypothetical protein [Solirubrobacteraceae bacterium]